jgi:hypothetical protein
MCSKAMMFALFTETHATLNNSGVAKSLRKLVVNRKAFKVAPERSPTFMMFSQISCGTFDDFCEASIG